VPLHRRPVAVRVFPTGDVWAARAEGSRLALQRTVYGTGRVKGRQGFLRLVGRARGRRRAGTARWPDHWGHLRGLLQALKPGARAEWG